ncbi:unannotated protein [freshwater metagenome]|uniref:Unannotated protein n=1 Tax=freshwater metagenome TaxID=449393 RepID=A0A6J6KJE1_9ZZZZ
MEFNATNVATPVVRSIVHVPSPLMVTVVPQRLVLGSTRHGPFTEPDCRSAPVPNPPLPITVVNVAVPPGNTDCVSGVAIGALGGSMVGVIVDVAVRPKESVA